MKQKAKLVINPPPSDARCECCGKHVSEVKPYGGPGDPLVGDFKGALLIKIFRPMAPRGNNRFDISDCMDNEGNLDEGKFVKKYSKKELEEFWIIEQLESTVGASWECRDCVILEEKEYFKKLEERLKE